MMILFMFVGEQVIVTLKIVKRRQLKAGFNRKCFVMYIFNSSSRKHTFIVIQGSYMIIFHNNFVSDQILKLLKIILPSYCRTIRPDYHFLFSPPYYDLIFFLPFIVMFLTKKLTKFFPD